ncbi:MAG: hypothetical protein M2R45_04771 [Verrucomicrobia subdivision 3 bacterium]|nr:hypothetical protein [Limisphaerales bacterium]MCS1415101.1 hypothetical protein [Limisphaerales bacterium]
MGYVAILATLIPIIGLNFLVDRYDKFTAAGESGDNL